MRRTIHRTSESLLARIIRKNNFVPGVDYSQLKINLADIFDVDAMECILDKKINLEMKYLLTKVESIKSLNLYAVEKEINSRDGVNAEIKKILMVSSVYAFSYQNYPLYIGLCNGSALERMRNHINSQSSANYPLTEVIRLNEHQIDKFSVLFYQVNGNRQISAHLERVLINKINPMCNNTHCNDYRVKMPPVELITTGLEEYYINGTK